MKTNRRKFLATASVLGGATAFAPVSSFSSPSTASAPDYSDLDAALRMPVLRKELFSDPVIIDKLELLRDRNNFIYRVRSAEGAVGISIGHPNIARNSYPMFEYSLHHHFVGKDARNLDRLLFNAVERNIKRQGIPLCVHIAGIEFAILDMLGNLAELPVGKLIGDIHFPEVSVYLGTRYAELRRMPPAESLELVQKDYEETGARAIKIRAGRGNNLGSDIDVSPGHTEKLIRMARERFGKEMVLMIDANGSYSPKEAIRIGRILQENDFYFYEESVPWDWYEEQKQVADALSIPMAGGEEEFGMHAFRWLIANDAFEILQPDAFYFGGMIRSMQVARMAAARGKTMVPHMSTGGLGWLYNIHFVSACPNAGEFHEFKLFATRDGNGTHIPLESKTEAFSCKDGVVKVPTGPGLGIVIDPDYIKTHQVIYG